MNSSKLDTRGSGLPHKQSGIATLLTVILMLLAMTIMALYGTRTGFFEQFASANDIRQKQAFNAAEAGINIVTERIRANSDLVLSSEPNGWFAPATQHWLPCPPLDPDSFHPCDAEPDSVRRGTSYYFVEDATKTALTNVSLGVDLLPSDENVEVGAVLCPLSVDHAVNPPVVAPNCTSTPDRDMLITLVSRASSDNGRGHALVKQTIAGFNVAAGTPGVALTAPFVGLPNGTADIVANPNGGGEGVPLSVWSSEPLGIDGALRTCEAYEFYDQPALPADISCPGCDCAAGSELSSKFTRYSDIRDSDPLFPPDLFEYFFGLPKANYESVKDTLTNVDSCQNLTQLSHGGYWVNGDCSISGNGCKIGTQDNPVLLVVAGDFSLSGCELYGMLFVTNAENPGEQLKVAMNGQASIYGAVMIDHNMKQSNGTLAIVYNEDVLTRVSNFNGIAALPGGWSDFL